MLTLYTDTDTDITPAVAAHYGYKLISMPYSVDAKTIYPYVDFDEFDSHAFYDMLRAGTLPTTSAISKERYKEYFEPEFAAGNDILYVHFSRAMTVTFEAMDQAVAELREKYPERRFAEIDTKGITTISYAIVRAVGDLHIAGRSLDEMLDWAREEVDHYAMYFFADDLKFFCRSGRVSGLAATMGTLIGIRPIIYMSPEGKMVSCGKTKGRVKAGRPRGRARRRHQEPPLLHRPHRRAGTGQRSRQDDAGALRQRPVHRICGNQPHRRQPFRPQRRRCLFPRNPPLR